LTDLLKRRHPNIAAVALANKNVRTVWAILAHGREFRPDYVPTRMAA
jgi:transposase